MYYDNQFPFSQLQECMSNAARAGLSERFGVLGACWAEYQDVVAHESLAGDTEGSWLGANLGLCAPGKKQQGA